MLIKIFLLIAVLLRLFITLFIGSNSFNILIPFVTIFYMSGKDNYSDMKYFQQLDFFMHTMYLNTIISGLLIFSLLAYNILFYYGFWYTSCIVMSGVYFIYKIIKNKEFNDIAKNIIGEEIMEKIKKGLISTTLKLFSIYKYFLKNFVIVVNYGNNTFMNRYSIKMKTELMGYFMKAFTEAITIVSKKNNIPEKEIKKNFGSFIDDEILDLNEINFD